MNKKITVVGTGMSDFLLRHFQPTQHNHVVAVDIIPEKVEMINNRKSPIRGEYIEKYLDEKWLDLTESIREKMGSENIIFSPEFLRESKALYDNLYPSCIIVSTDCFEQLNVATKSFADLLQERRVKENSDTLFMGFTEAEAKKLFVNTYLALCVSQNQILMQR